MTQGRVRRLRRLRRVRQAPRRAVVRTGPAAGVLLLLVTAGTAFMATITGLPVTSAARVVIPYPTYTLTSGPTLLDGAVWFSVSPAAGQTRARYDDGTSPAWSTCSSTDAGTNWSCGSGLTGVGSFQWFATP